MIGKEMHATRSQLARNLAPWQLYEALAKASTHAANGAAMSVRRVGDEILSTNAMW